MKTRRLAVYALSFVLLAPLLAACGPTVSGTVDDATITQRIKVLFLNDSAIRPQDIEVKTFKGSVTLSGRVASKQEEEKAIGLARTIRGVKTVTSTMKYER